MPHPVRSPLRVAALLNVVLVLGSSVMSQALAAPGGRIVITGSITAPTLSTRTMVPDGPSVASAATIRTVTQDQDPVVLRMTSTPAAPAHATLRFDRPSSSARVSPSPVAPSLVLSASDSLGRRLAPNAQGVYTVNGPASSWTLNPQGGAVIVTVRYD